MIEKMKLLFAVVLAYRHNLHMLHWKVVGCDFDTIHKLLDDYVDKFNTFVDEIAEMLLSIGHNPLTLQEAITLLSDLNTHILVIESQEDYESDKVFKALDIMFNDLYTMYTDISNECEYSECVSKFDEHKYWLRVEGKYKNKKRLEN